ncbi:MAG: IS66 family transposase [bacterium]
MRPLEHIHDADTLRQIVVLQQRQIEILAERLQAIQRRIAEAKAEDAQLVFLSEIGRLEQQVAQLEQRAFGDSSERRRSSRSATDEPTDPARGHGPRQQSLPIEEQVHVLPEGERGCPSCGGELDEWAGQYEDGDEITVEMRTFKLVRHRRQKYRCGCNGAVVTAPGPRKLIPGGRYSIGFGVDVAIAKYLDHLPLERQVRVMAREGLTITSQTLWDQLEALAEHLAPSYDALIGRILASPVVHADETWWRLMGAKSSPKRWWAWGVGTGDAVAYRILASRSTEAAKTVLGDYHGIAMVDGYGAYEALSRASPGMKLAHCWAHVRRKYLEIEQWHPIEVEPVLRLIGELYAVERSLAGASPDQIRMARHERSRPLVVAICDWALMQRGSPGSALRKAIQYMLGMWSGLTLFLDDPRVPLDNNAIERAMRGPVVGRKNHYGSRSKRGTEVAALFYSLLETAKLCGVDPKHYLTEAAHRAIDKPGALLLPHNLR